MRRWSLPKRGGESGDRKNSKPGDARSAQLVHAEYIGGRTSTTYITQMKLSAFVTAAAAIGGSSLIAVPVEARNESIVAYDPVVTCEANYRQAPYDMKC